MTPLYLEDIVLTSMVALLAAYQLMSFAQQVDVVRIKYKIPYPYVIGNDNFERAFRAHQNSLEYFPVFMIALWTSSLFFHQVPSSLVGLVYIYSRQEYFKGYSRSVPDRIPGYKRSVKCLKVMFGMALIAFTTIFLRSYGEVDLADVVHSVMVKTFGISTIRLTVV